MNKTQQELYEKLLKKVNEYCLGQAAEDVIAAIDALVDTYESRSSTNMDLDDALKVIYDSQDIMGGHDDFWKAYRTIEKALKALEVLKECFDFEGFDEFIPNGKWFEKDIEERKKLLKEMTK